MSTVIDNFEGSIALAQSTATVIGRQIQTILDMIDTARAAGLGDTEIETMRGWVADREIDLEATLIELRQLKVDQEAAVAAVQADDINGRIRLAIESAGVAECAQLADIFSMTAARMWEHLMGLVRAGEVSCSMDYLDDDAVHQFTINTDEGTNR